MTSQAIIFTLSCIGISETVYLVKERLLSQKPICPIGDDCSIVLESKYNKIFLIPNDVAGLLFYITCSLLTAFLVIGIGPLPLWDIMSKILIAGGSVLSVFLTYLQFKIIKAWCFWCLMSACTIWLMGIVILFSNFIK